MRPFQDSQDESKIDNQHQQKRLLFYSLGREEDPRVRKEQEEELRQRSHLVKQLEPYQRYHKLREEEKSLRLLLEEAETTLSNIAQERDRVVREKAQLENVKKEYLDLMGQIKTGQEMEYRISVLYKQIECLGDISSRVDREAIGKYLQCIDSLKREIMDAQGSMKKDNERQRELIQGHQDFIAQRHELWKYYVETINELETELEAKEREKLTLASLADRIEAKQSRRPRQHTQIRRKKVLINRLQAKQTIPRWYFIWTILLLLWLLWLLFSGRPSPKLIDQTCY